MLLSCILHTCLECSLVDRLGWYTIRNITVRHDVQAVVAVWPQLIQQCVRQTLYYCLVLTAICVNHTMDKDNTHFSRF